MRKVIYLISALVAVSASGIFEHPSLSQSSTPGCYALTGGNTCRADSKRWSDNWVEFPEVGIDCTGKSDSTRALQSAINAMPNDSTLMAPAGCITSLSSTILIRARVNVQIMSMQRPLDCNQANAPSFVWTGKTAGPMFNLIDDDSPTIQGFYFRTTTSINTVINIDGNGSFGQTPTLAMVKYNSFCFANLTNSNFVAISISATSNNNNENYTIEENDIECSSAVISFRATDGATNGTTTVTSASANFTTRDVGQRIRVSYSGGIIDSTITSSTSSTTVVMAAPTWSSSTTYNQGSLVTGSDSNLYLSLLDVNTNNNPVGGPRGNWGSVWTQTGATIHVGQEYGIGIYQAGSNSFHERYYGNRIKYCSKAFSINGGGTFSVSHYGGGFNDVGFYLNSSNGMIDYYDAEGDVQAIVIRNGYPLIIHKMRLTVSDSVANGWINIFSNGNLTVEGLSNDGTPPKNWVLFNDYYGSVARIVSINNNYNLSFKQVNFCSAAIVSFVNDTFASLSTQSGYCGTTGLPKSSAGLPAGAIYNNSGVLTVVP